MAQQQSAAQGSVGMAQQNQPGFTEDQFMNWSDTNPMANVPAYTDPTLFDQNFVGSMQNGMYANGQRLATEVPSTELVRRNNNHQLAHKYDYAGGLPGHAGWEAVDDEEDLEAQALKARKEAQAKRKQIPPFVQKLSSFLDNSNHTDLIRWSDDGNSFIVIDEDEFAKTLIPELFKHNNYASFVRQLNMYGFHKKVGLSDNSMKQAERRDKKTPSEYHNKYFKRGRPELLWLIQKPKNPQSNAKRKRDDDKKGHDSDDEGRKYGNEGNETHGFNQDGANSDMQLIPKADYNSMRTEIRQLQHQQKLISNIISQMRRQNEQWFQEATQFQKMHERHESSINAILTFLATFYNRSLEGQNGVNMNIADMFPSTNLAQNTTSHKQGSVVDMGDYQEVEMPKQTSVPRQNKKPLALLPPPTARDSRSQSPRVQTQTPSSRPYSPKRTNSFYKQQAQTKQAQSQQTQAQQANHMNSSPQQPLNHDFSSASASPAIRSKPAPSPSMPMPETTDDMMSVINSVNANNNIPATGPQFDFPAALSHYQTADGNTPLTQAQREEILSLMNAASPNSNADNANSSNNALSNPQPPPMPSLEHFGHHDEQIDVLQKLQEEQAARVHHLSERLAPMSPNGNIPGLNSYGNYNNHANAPPSDFDLDSFINTDAGDYFQNTGAGPTGSADTNFPAFGSSNMDFDFGAFEAATNQNLFGGEDGNDAVSESGGRIVESVSSAATSPADAGAETGREEREKTPRKKRRISSD
ncbi:uncharacterized protein K452DRAFT_309798 [Aplosporella prunicola CBS 121167]|uniref:HSF-type DNA-binding domain-containing protein n=1 Tax=Aplosporella prunicola CBS 121167 TaxID=1176127 RepID=A0A6A6B8V1_9PEZI|nr:uncharacterized protein K452DRAFT_309798 [Aplosporella prunicola CBS 121167]KAF2140682.1 hypothetical protein K452DRAFT_309798 [Aplosporella prunicola CBS 121167]